MEEENKSFLGTGWSFPPKFNIKKNEIETVSQEEDIRQSINILLSTMPGERIMRPDYGCDLMSLVFERLSSSTEMKVIDMVSSAILRYEPRIILEEIQVEMSSEDFGLLLIYLEYTIRSVNTRDNIVYPFYLYHLLNFVGGYASL